MAGLGALADLQLHHLDLVQRGSAGKMLRREAAVGIARAEIARADLPDEVAAVLAVIGAQAAFAGIMGETAGLGALVEGANGVRAQGAEAHGRDVEHRGVVGLGAVGAADGDPERLDRVRPRHHRVLHPFESVAIDVVLGPERALVEHHLGALIDHRPLVAAERRAVLFALEEVLPHLRPQMLQEEAQMRGDRIIAQHRVAGLQQVAGAENGQPGEQCERHGRDIGRLGNREDDEEQRRREQDAQRVADEAGRECQRQHAHGSPLSIMTAAPYLPAPLDVIRPPKRYCE